jgi:hypothetical protein
MRTSHDEAKDEVAELKRQLEQLKMSENAEICNSIFHFSHFF